MQAVELLVTLKIPDVSALTAANALRRRMGYGDVLKELTRADYYRLELNVEDEAQARALADEIAEQTSLFVNPNKNTYQVRTAGETPNPRQEDGLWVIDILVTDIEGAAAPDLTEALRKRLGYGETVVEVQRGILWSLKLDCAGPEEAKRLAEEIAVTRSRDRGLLVNPHFQTWCIP